MLPSIELAEAAGRRWDVILAGSSFASMFFLHGLDPRLSVLVVEKGGFVPHERQLREGQGRFAEDLRMESRAAETKRWVAHTMFGGNSNCWWACTPRFHPRDLALKSRYGVGADWPLTYDDLEPYYADAEAIMEINGLDAPHLLPRSAPFPHPPHAPSRSDIRLRAHGRDWIAQPSARATTGSRAPCCANGVCHLCPVDAKFTIENGFERFRRPGLRVLTGVEARQVDIANGIATGLVVRGDGGRETTVKGDLVALGTNAVFNPAILLRSGLKAPALGRYLHEQASQTATIDIASDGNYFGGTSITGHGYALYDGEHRREAGAVLLENWNAPPRLRTERGRWLDRLHLKLVAEDLPQAQNRVHLQDDEPLIEWHGHDGYAYRGLARARERLPGLLPDEVEAISFSGFAETEAHIQGTTRMGRSIEDGVIDRDLVTFECRNLLALGAGAFPSASAANPTLTLSALSLRAARRLTGGGEA